MVRTAPLVILLAVACGPPAASPEELGKVEVPPQPVQPVAHEPAPPPPPPADAAAPQRFACTGGTPFQLAGRSYCAHEDALDWTSAEARCVDEGGHLLAFEDRALRDSVHDFLGSEIEAKRAMWIGLELASRARHTWKWASGDPVKATSWAAGEPNDENAHESCGEWLVATGTWNDTRCELEQPFLCQPPPKISLRCPPPSRNVPGKDGMTYCYVPSNVTYAVAKKSCVLTGGFLATPKTAAENEALTRAIRQRFPVTRMWIGLTDIVSPGQWMWTSGVAPAFTDWLPGEPNAYLGDEHCVELHNDTWQWNDLSCAEKLPSVCQAPGPG